MASDGKGSREPDFASLFDLDELQRIQDAFAQATGVASLITLPDGTPVTRPSNFCRLCNDIIRRTEKGRENCRRSDACLGRHDPAGPVVQPCLSGGLWDAGASIHLEGRHVANWLIGQVRDESQALEGLLAYADVIGADREQFREALAEVTVMSEGQFRKVAEALYLMANLFSRQAYLIRRQEDLLRSSRAVALRHLESERKFRTIFDSVTECLFVHDPETGAILDVNRRACEEYGYAKEEMLRLDVSMLSSGVPPYDQEHARRFMERAARGERQRFEWRARSRDGSLFWQEVSIRRARIGGADRLLVSARDITANKQAQEDAQREKAFTDAIMDSVPGLLYLYDAEGRLVRWNKKHEELTGYSSEELSRMTLMDWYKDDPVEMEKILKAVERIGVEGFSATEGNLRNKDGSHRLYYFTAVPLTLEGRSYFAGIGIDIAERKRLQEFMVQTEKMMCIAGLTAGMAHEINNPLSGILQGLQVLQSRLFGDSARNREAASHCGCSLETLRAYLGRRELDAIITGIRDAAARAARVVANMLEFCRRSESHLAPCDVRVLLDKAVELCASDYDLTKKFDFRNILIEREYAQDLPLVPCTATQLEQVFINLLKNAAQAMSRSPRDGRPPRITLRARGEGEFVAVEVADNGPGMSEEVRGRVFEPFYTTKAPGEGTGLGLSVSFFIITEAHKGAIEVESSPGRGARFIVRLPCVPA
ncbi:Sporulation kinase E [Fundidesulfovibrio magnetotacticus]|uniref:histidine kinase n=1 Tax=Fundidesulfovibrio magnetotacticus TaxID=2730080 RepID=A0A6V8LKJ6_9BACT|nr:PocR ligand-binding domain-containing protein [Fundidesulfovibrio magnetotacticus]GFK92204.1 Sporulation kinase E [Fundidesulfovibrio magnetotacticus]